jgi:hypothetical protein
METSTCFLELLAFWVHLVTARRRYTRTSGMTVRWHTDSQAAVGAWKAQKSEHDYICTLLAKMGAHCASRNILVEVVHRGRETPEMEAADLLTHDLAVSFSQATGIPTDRRVRPTAGVLSFLQPSRT